MKYEDLNDYLQGNWDGKESINRSRENFEAAHKDPSTYDYCEDAAEGRWCHREVTWAMNEGIHKNPDHFPGLTEDSTFKEFQAFLHAKGKGLCKKPCDLPVEEDVAIKDDLFKDVGEWCRNEILYAKYIGIQRHPELFPGLTERSSFKEFQAFLLGQGKCTAKK